MTSRLPEEGLPAINQPEPGVWDKPARKAMAVFGRKKAKDAGIACIRLPQDF
jgi:hypothetical protein